MKYSMQTRSISWLLMSRLLVLPGHQQLQYWLCIFFFCKMNIWNVIIKLSMGNINFQITKWSSWDTVEVLEAKNFSLQLKPTIFLIIKSVSSMRHDFNYLSQFQSNEWCKTQIHLYISWKQFCTLRVNIPPVSTGCVVVRAVVRGVVRGVVRAVVRAVGVFAFASHETWHSSSVSKLLAFPPQPP